MKAEISNIESVQSTIDGLLAIGVRDVILSPGSRNAPFLLSFSRIDAFNCISVVDERTAAFMALGMAQQTKRPVVVCCTSGSAMLNYAPAIGEAFYQHIPIIMLTADRPSEWIDHGEGQSIRQREVLNGILLDATSLGEQGGELRAEDKLGLERVLNTVIEKHGPVQINVHLNEPLYEMAQWVSPKTKWKFPKRKSLTAPGFDEVWDKSSRILVLVTQLTDGKRTAQWLAQVSDDPRVAVVTETTANIQKLGYVSCIDRTLEMFAGQENEPDFIPDLLITIGENIISKKIKTLFRRNGHLMHQHWHFGPVERNTFDCLTNWVLFSGNDSLPKVVAKSCDSNFGTIWKSAFFRSEQLHLDFLKNAPFSDLKVFELIHNNTPLEGVFQMGNSSVVRYIQLFNQLADVSYFGNRGVSGIEGCTSTAVGAALMTDRPVLFVSGDHAFRYDANGLSFEHLPSNLKIIVINNEGGNIFRIIDGPTRHIESDQFVEHTQQKSIRKLVEYHGIGYSSAHDLEELERELDNFWNGTYPKAHVLEVFTPRLESPKVLQSYFQHLNQGA